MAHTFYYGLHPVSWFILFANVAITILEWQFLFSRFFQINWQSKGKESKTTEAEN